MGSEKGGGEAEGGGGRGRGEGGETSGPIHPTVNSAAKQVRWQASG